jgi:TolB protein
MYATAENGGIIDLVWTDRTGKITGKIEWSGENSALAISPDGNSVAISSEENGNRDIWVLDLTRGSRVRLTFDAGSENAPVWSRDGQWVTYSAVRGEKQAIARKRANGSGEEEILVSGDAYVYPSDYSPDGRFLIYCQILPQTNSDLMLLPLQGDERKPIVWQQSFAEEVQAVFSPDGRYVVYTHIHEGSDVVARDFPSGGGRWQISTGSGRYPRWSADGREIYYLDGARRLISVPLAPGPRLQPGTPKVLFDSPLLPSHLSNYRYGVLPGGQRFLLNGRLTHDRDQTLTLILNWRPGR